LNPPKTFAGRKVGALVTDGVDRSLLEALRQALDAEGAMLEIVAPTVGGVEAADGSRIEANEKIGGGPSVLYDAVAVLPSEQGANLLLSNGSAKDFVSDAFAHLKFIAYVNAALPLFEKAGIPGSLDEGFIALKGPKGVAQFVAACRKLRLWRREQVVIT
jgi:catalase